MRSYAPVVSHLVICLVIAVLVGALAWALADTAAYGIGVAAVVMLLGLVTAPWPRRDARGRQPTGMATSRSAGRPSASSTRARSSR